MSEWQRENFVISTDKARLQPEAIQKFLLEESYWAKSRTYEQTLRAIENSICFGLYLDDRQIGFARVVSDQATFAYIGDVYILDEFRGQGLSKWLMEIMISYPDLQGLRRWLLATRDAHGLYAQYEFTPLKAPERWMERSDASAYLS
jgi:GNAT superfamily N-acetyltransferase